MRNLDDYISEAFKYIFSDIKKGLVGGLLCGISGAFGGLMSMFISVAIESQRMCGIHFSGEYTHLFILSLIGLLISFILGFLVDGYYVRVLKTTVEGSNKLPEWNNFVNLLVKGFLYAVGGLILMIIFLFPLIVVGIMGIYSLIIRHSIGVGLSLLFASLLISIPLFIALIFYLPLAKVNFSIRGFLGFFEFKRIFKLMSIKYILLVIIIWIITLIIELVVSSPFIFLHMFYPMQTLTCCHSATSFMPTLIINLMLPSLVSGFVGFFMELFFLRAIALYYKDKIERV